MKHLKCTILFIYLYSIALAQDKSEYTYQPFIMDGTGEWQSREYQLGIGDVIVDNRRVISNEDSVYQGQTYKKIYDYPSCSTNEKDKVYAGMIREENKRVYFVSNYNFWNRPKDTECLLYDFNLGVGDEITYSYFDRLKVRRIDTIQVEGMWRRKFYFEYLDYIDSIYLGIGYDYWLEGIGCEYYRGITEPFAPVLMSTMPQIRCVVHGDSVLYKQNPEEECPCDKLNDLSEMIEESRISFYVKDQMLCINAPEQIYTRLDIYSLDGKLIRSVTFHEKMNQIAQSLSGIPPGNYLFIVASADRQQSGQFIVR